ncbi:hypothetical protein MRS44_017918 [Fusarium solani]|uniref:uncharacterized protein n=1 Tax=Fusarium solani TaxID=169388 RepID=UPI0032C3DE93|nr:hypothetical protein MRS44_017918 [Fusarium solani]
MSRPTTFSNTIHLRDFVDAITDDPTRENAPNYVEIQTDINIFEEDGFCGSHVDIDPIHTRIHAYLTREERELCTPNTFFYADGRFSAAQSPSGVLQISVQALSLMRHPGDVSNFDETGDPSEPRRFTVETSVYDSSKSAPVAFSVACFLEITKRWHRVKTPTAGALLSITAKIAGRTTDTNQLALRVLDLAYLPRPAPVPTAAPTPSSTPTSKRSVRWEGRATPSTPSKRQRGDESASAAGPSYESQPPQAIEDRSRLSIAEESANPSTNPPSPSTMADADESSITLAPSPGPDDNFDYNSLKHEIKVHTTRDQVTAVAIPGHQDTTLQRFEDDLYAELDRQHNRLGLFVASKADEISRRLGASPPATSTTPIMLTSTIEDLSKAIGRWLSKSHDQLDAEQSVKVQRLFVKYERELLRCGRDIQSLPRFANAQVVAFRKIIKKYKVNVLHPRLIAPLGSNSMDTEMDRLDNPRFPLQQEHLVRPSEFHKRRLPVCPSTK